MRTNLDLDGLTQGWPYEVGHIKARWIFSADGQPKVQLRLDLGLLQMAVSGRPDGQQPFGFESLLHYYRDLERRDPGVPELQLDNEALSGLQQETMQYYYRYLAFSALDFNRGVIRDTRHNLEVLALAERRASDRNETMSMLQFYPYIRMMNARALAEKHLRLAQHGAAEHTVERAMEDIRAFGLRHGTGLATARHPELETLGALLKTIHHNRPLSRADKLRTAMTSAIEREDYEEAARLRDALTRLKKV